MNVAAALSSAVRTLTDAGVASPDADVEILLGETLGRTRGQVKADALLRREIPESAGRRFGELVARRARREPLQHILGVAWFRGLDLAVGPGVFVPRPETEITVEQALKELPPTGSALDLGTGTGAIAFALAVERPRATVSAVESSPVAFTWARRNQRSLRLDGVHLIHADFGSPDEYAGVVGRVDVVASNPPYIPENVVLHDPEVRCVDPAAALYAGRDGLDAVRVIARVARDLLQVGGALVLEHGDDQTEGVAAILAAEGWRDIRMRRDLTGRPRVTRAEL